MTPANKGKDTTTVRFPAEAGSQPSDSGDPASIQPLGQSKDTVVGRLHAYEGPRPNNLGDFAPVSPAAEVKVAIRLRLLTRDGSAAEQFWCLCLLSPAGMARQDRSGLHCQPLATGALSRLRGLGAALYNDEELSAGPPSRGPEDAAASSLVARPAGRSAARGSSTSVERKAQRLLQRRLPERLPRPKASAGLVQRLVFHE